MLLHSFHMIRVITDGKDAAMDHRMQCLHASVHHFRETGHFRNGLDRNAGIRDGFHRAAGGNDLHAQFMKAFCKFYDTGLIRYADQCSFNCH